MNTLAELKQQIDPNNELDLYTGSSEIEAFKAFVSFAALYAPAMVHSNGDNLSGMTGERLHKGKRTANMMQLFEYLTEVKQHHDEQAVKGMNDNARIMFKRDNPDEFSYAWYVVAAGVVAKRAAAGDAVCGHIVRSGLAVSESIMDSALFLDHVWSPEFGSYSRVMC